MNFLSTDCIMETIEMIKVHRLDIRTVTLALSLRDCITLTLKKPGIEFTQKSLNMLQI